MKTIKNRKNKKNIQTLKNIDNLSPINTNNKFTQSDVNHFFHFNKSKNCNKNYKKIKKYHFTLKNTLKNSKILTTRDSQKS